MALKSFTCTVVCPPKRPFLEETDPFSEQFSFAAAREEAKKRTEESLALIDKAAGGGLVVHPEDISGIRQFWRSLDRPDYFTHLAEYIPGRTTKRACRIARKKKSHIILSLYEKNSAKLFNTTVLITPKGKIKAKYRKTHPAPGEDWLVWPGHSFVVFNSEIGVIGLACGEDYLFPETACTLARMGAEIIVIPSRYPIPELMLTCRSYELGLITIMAQADESFMIDQAGRILTQSAGRRGFLLTTNFEKDVVIEEERDPLDTVLTGEPVRRRRIAGMRKPKAYKLLTRKNWPEASPHTASAGTAHRNEVFRTLLAEWEEGNYPLPEWEL